MEKEKIILNGIGASSGIAIGKTIVFSKTVPFIVEKKTENTDIDIEISRLTFAIEKSKKELKKILVLAEPKLGDRAKILEAQIMILEDNILLQTIYSRIKSEMKNAEYIVSNEIEKYKSLILTSNNDYIRERANDMDDLKNRVIRNLQEEKLISKLDKDKIIISHNLTTADVIILSRNNVLAYVTEIGGLNSHATLLSRSLQIPFVIGIQNLLHYIDNDTEIIVDGSDGIIIVNPTQTEILKYQEKEKFYKKTKEERHHPTQKITQTSDGKRIEISANVEFEEEINCTINSCAEGIGLFRTESFLIDGELPNEETQFLLYKKLSEKMFPNRVVIRIFDIGGDKLGPYAIDEENPFLGWRGIRITLDDIEIFKTQIKAILRASEKKNLQILLPMVSCVDEVKKAKKIIEEVKLELEKNKILFDKIIPIGIMIEVPSVVFTLKKFLNEVDFLSIGTNDLTQYILAVDRGNSFVSGIYSEFHPSVLTAIKTSIELANKKNKWISVCGDFASNPLGAILLVGLGIDSLSVIPSTIENIKNIISNISFDETKKIAKKVLQFNSSSEIEKFLKKKYEKIISL